MSSFEKYLFRSFVNFQKLIICLFINELQQFVTYSEYKFLIRYMICEYFLLFYWFSFHFLNSAL